MTFPAIEAERGPLRSVELFAGGGGMALGMHGAGFEHEALVEIDTRACAVLRNAELRPELWKVDAVQEIDVQSWLKQVRKGHFTNIDLVAGGPPCQPFSTAGARAGHNDDRNMFSSGNRGSRDAEAENSTFENVPGLLRPGFIGCCRLPACVAGADRNLPPAPATKHEPALWTTLEEPKRPVISRLPGSDHTRPTSVCRARTPFSWPSGVMSWEPGPRGLSLVTRGHPCYGTNGCRKRTGPNTAFRRPLLSSPVLDCSPSRARGRWTGPTTERWQTVRDLLSRPAGTSRRSTVGRLH